MVMAELPYGMVNKTTNFNLQPESHGEHGH